MMHNSHGKRTTQGRFPFFHRLQATYNQQGPRRAALTHVGLAICMGMRGCNRNIRFSCSKHVRIARLLVVSNHFMNGTVDESPSSNASSRNNASMSSTLDIAWMVHVDS